MSKNRKDGHQDGQQAGQYDKIWRENMHAALPGIIHKVLEIEVLRSFDLPDKLLITKQREVDVLQQVEDSAGNSFILHIEIQTKDDADMVYGMAEYSIMIQRQYKMPVRQYVIYIGKGSSKMVTGLNSTCHHFEYRLISLSQISYRLFLSSERPEEHLLAILGNLEGEDPESVLSAILRKVHHSAEGELAEGRYLQQLRILIQLRNLGKQFDRAMEKVSKFFKEEKDPFFQRGVRKGIEQGMEKGIERGKEEVVQNLITELGLSDEQTARVAGVTIEFVSRVRTSFTSK